MCVYHTVIACHNGMIYVTTVVRGGCFYAYPCDRESLIFPSELEKMSLRRCRPKVTVTRSIKILSKTPPLSTFVLRGFDDVCLMQFRGQIRQQSDKRAAYIPALCTHSLAPQTPPPCSPLCPAPRCAPLGQWSPVRCRQSPASTDATSSTPVATPPSRYDMMVSKEK